MRWFRPALRPDLKKKLASRWTGPWTVIRQSSPVNFILRNEATGAEATAPANVQDLLVVDEH